MTQDTKEEVAAKLKVGDVIGEGEGDYDSYNTGTKYKLISGHKPLETMTVNQILAASKRTDRDRIFAAGKYQIITGTLASAKAALGLSGNELFTPELQDRIFLTYLIRSKRKEIGDYITKGKGTSEDAVYASAKEWASVEVPAGRKVASGAVSNGHNSYYGSKNNHAHPGSGPKLKAALEKAHAVYADPSQTTVPEPLTPQEAAGSTENTTELQPGHLIKDSVGKNGANHEDDVGAVQQALANHGQSPGAIDHKVGPKTIAAIMSFQRTFMNPDGLVEAGRSTEKHLLDGTAPQQEQKPQQPQQPKETVEPSTSGSLKALMDKEHLTPEEISKARSLIAAEPASARAQLYETLQSKVIYFNQRDNKTVGRHNGKVENLGDYMCNLTSLAMCLEYLGVSNPHPDLAYPDALEKIRLEKLPNAERTTEAGWGGVARVLGVQHKQLGGGRHARAWWMATVEAALRSGAAVMCSIEDHIIRIQDVKEDGVVADDPYGHSKLLAGKTHRTKKGTLTSHEWLETNHKGGTQDGKRDNAGEDITWPWAEVEAHNFLWIASFTR
jgi:muramidase (phage lysozyme)/peptidoglycan hydrolase-like protein with peptidoglycan-binding domain